MRISLGILVVAMVASTSSADLFDLLSPTKGPSDLGCSGAGCSGIECDACDVPETPCVVCRPHQVLRTVEVEQWSVSTEPACVSWCKVFTGIGGCLKGVCSQDCVQGPDCRCSRVRPRNRLMRLTEVRYVPTVEHFAELECSDCDYCENVAGVQLQASPETVYPAMPTGNSKTYWIDEQAKKAPPLGAWTAPVEEISDASPAATVHWVQAPPAPAWTLDESSPVYRVSDQRGASDNQRTAAPVVAPARVQDSINDSQVNETTR